MIPLVVVENPKRWPLELEGAEVVSARAYLTEARWAQLRRAAVYNVCRHYGYQTVGYYVSLLAAARGHRILPSVDTLQALGEGTLVRIASEEMDELIQRSLAPLRSDEFQLSVYFGRNVALRYDRLARALFNQFPAPFLRARFQWMPMTRHGAGVGGAGSESPATGGRDGGGGESVDGAGAQGRWRLVSIRPVPGSEVPDAHREFVVEQARSFFQRPTRTRSRPEYRFDMAILVNPDEEHPPSNDGALKRFVRAAAGQGIGAELVRPDDYGRIAEYDALFIRETTAVEHRTYRFATRAAAAGLIVLDHPDSIVRCGNKVYQAELFERHDIPCPRTLVVHEGNVDEVVATVGLPCVLKKPDGAFSQGVALVRSEEELRERLPALLKESELVVAQTFTPSSFDWRVGVLDRKALFVCRYHMTPGHWQIVQGSGSQTRFGKVEPVPMEEAPARAVELAVKAAGLVGDGLYGVDVKEIEGRFLVMEINDNPNMDSGYEDGLLGGALYDAVMGWFRERLEARGGAGGP